MLNTVVTTQPDIERIISDIPLFSGLTEDKKEKLAKVCSIGRYSIGKPIISRGAEPEGLYVISSGRVRSLFQESGSGAVHTLRLLGPGEMFGWVNLMRHQSTEVVTASEESVCLQIPSESISMLINALPRFYDLVSSATDPAEICVLLESIYSSDPRKESRLLESGFSGIHELALSLFHSAVVVDTGFSRAVPSKKLQWFVSRSDDPDYPLGTEYHPSGAQDSH